MVAQKAQTQTKKKTQIKKIEKKIENANLFAFLSFICVFFFVCV